MSQMRGQWIETLTTEQLDTYFSDMAKLDPDFATRAKRYWLSRSREELTSLSLQAWNCNDVEQHQLANSYLKLILAGSHTPHVIEPKITEPLWRGPAGTSWKKPNL